MPFDAYKCYLSLKNHFTKDSYDYHKYCGKSRTTVQSFYKRKDRFWFEKLARNKDDKEVENFFIANLVDSDDPGTLWIGEMMRSGDSRYSNWQKRQQSLSYIFTQETKDVFEDADFKQIFNCSTGHPPLLKMYLGKKICLETLVIYDKIFGFRSDFDKKLDDPVWQLVSMKIRKYSPFIHIDVFRYKKIVKGVVLK